MIDLTKPELDVLKSLDTPYKIQKFLDSIPFNYEEKGETCMSPRRVLRERKANCIEGAMLAGVALMIHGEKPLVLNLKVSKNDYDHIITLYKRNGYWGAISKTNHSVLRFRDPVYKTLRELVLSYFHEYFLIANGEKTLKGYSKPINLKRFGVKWITSEEDLWGIAEHIFDMKHEMIIPKENEKFITRASDIEIKGASIKEWK